MGNIKEKGHRQNKLMGNMVMGKCKYKQKKSHIDQTGYKHFKQG